MSTPDAVAWGLIGEILDRAWPGDFTEADEFVYRTVLADYPPDVIAGALKRLVASGREFYPRPSASDVAGECNALMGRRPLGGFDAPPYGELASALDECAFDRGDYSPMGWRSSAGVDRARRELGELVATWFAGGGLALIRAYGAADDRVRRSYETFVAAQRERHRHADTTVTRLAPGGAVAHGGARRELSS